MAYSLIERYYLSQLTYIAFIIFLFIFQTFAQIPYLASITLFLALIPIAIKGITDLFHRKLSNELFLVIATLIAFVGHEERAITVVLLIMLIAHYIEHIIEDRTENALESLVKLIPTDVLIKTDHEEKIIPLKEVVPGMLIIIKSGGRIPVDGIIKEGEASIQEAVLTGESVPQRKSSGELVFAGTFLDEGSIVIEAQKIGEQTLFGKIQLLLEQASASKAKVVRLTEKISAFFTPTFLIFLAIVWFLTHNVQTVITLLIFGSPLELALVTPLTLLAAIVAAFRRGILIKDNGSLELLASSDVIVFDKTGTLTIGSPEVISITSFNDNYSQNDILFIAAIAEKKSSHALAQSILKKAHEQSLQIPDPDTFISLTGHGITMSYKNNTYLVGNRHFIEAREHGNLVLPAACKIDSNLTTVYIAIQKEVIGEICLEDEIKPDAKEVINQLKALSQLHTVLLSGDKQTVAQKVGRQLGIDEVFGEIMPDIKLQILKQLQQEGHIVTMVGDGINDAPALKQAHVGIAIGSMGMEPAIQAADIVLMSPHLDQIIFLYELAQKTMLTIKQNLIIGFALTHALGIVITLAGWVTPIQAAVIHALSDLVILLNAAKLTRFKR